MSVFNHQNEYLTWLFTQREGKTFTFFNVSCLKEKLKHRLKERQKILTKNDENKVQVVNETINQNTDTTDATVKSSNEDTVIKKVHFQEESPIVYEEVTKEEATVEKNSNVYIEDFAEDNEVVDLKETPKESLERQITLLSLVNSREDIRQDESKITNEKMYIENKRTKMRLSVKTSNKSKNDDVTVEDVNESKTILSESDPSNFVMDHQYSDDDNDDNDSTGSFDIIDDAQAFDVVEGDLATENIVTIEEDTNENNVDVKNDDITVNNDNIKIDVINENNVDVENDDINENNVNVENDVINENTDDVKNDVINENNDTVVDDVVLSDSEWINISDDEGSSQLKVTM